METRLVDPALVRAASRSNSGYEAGRSMMLGDPAVRDEAGQTIY